MKLKMDENDLYINIWLGLGFSPNFSKSSSAKKKNHTRPPIRVDWRLSDGGISCKSQQLPNHRRHPNRIAMCQSQPRLETCWACWKMVVRATIKTWNCENPATKTETKMSSPKHGTELNMHCCQRGSNQVIVTMILMTMDMIMITHDHPSEKFQSPSSRPFSTVLWQWSY